MTFNINKTVSKYTNKTQLERQKIVVSVWHSPQNCSFFAFGL